jgi:hypothetical protein
MKAVESCFLEAASGTVLYNKTGTKKARQEHFGGMSGSPTVMCFRLPQTCV